ncbi:hypothetical protein ABK040_010496 [Willaertia magna]
MEQLSNDEWRVIFCFLEIDDVLKNCCLTCLNFYKIITNENTEISQRINYLKNLNNTEIGFYLNIENKYLFDFLTIACRLQKLPIKFIENNSLDKNIKQNYWKSEIFSFSLISYNNFYVKNYLENNNLEKNNLQNNSLQKLFKSMVKEQFDLEIISCFIYKKLSFLNWMELEESLQKFLQKDSKNLQNNLEKIKKIYSIIVKQVDYPVNIYNNNLPIELKDNPEILYNAMSLRFCYHNNCYNRFPFLYLQAGINAQLNAFNIFELLKTKQKYRLFKNPQEQLECFKEILKLEKIRNLFICQFFNNYNGKKDLKEIKEAIQKVTESNFFNDLLINIRTYRSFAKVIPNKYWEDVVLLKTMLLIKPIICVMRSRKFWCKRLKVLEEALIETDNNHYLQIVYNKCNVWLQKKTK